MALPQFLSALRELILVEDDLPENLTERRGFFEERFSNLSQLEREDLARLSPEKIRIYQGTIFRGELSTLESHFPVSLALLNKHWADAFGEHFDGVKFVREMLKKHAWRGYLTRALCESFLRHLASDLPLILEHCPFMLEIAELESETLKVSRAPDDRLSARDSIPVDKLATLTVSELMSVPYFLPSNVSFKAFEHDVLALRIKFYEAGERLPVEDAVSRSPVWAAGSRNPAHFVRWNRLSRAIFEYLAEQKRLELLELPALAQVYCDESSEAGEAEQFAGFLSVLMSMIATGTIVLPSDSTQLE